MLPALYPQRRMTAHRTQYPTHYAVGPYRLVTLRRRRGYAIIDSRTGQYAYTARHPNGGRAYVPAVEPNVDRALAIARMMADDL
jgi:hypothetical protein